MAERDSLAAELAVALDDTTPFRVLATPLADVILASDWLAEHDREVLDRYADSKYGVVSPTRPMGDHELSIREAAGTWPVQTTTDAVPQAKHVGPQIEVAPEWGGQSEWR